MIHSILSQYQKNKTGDSSSNNIVQTFGDSPVDSILSSSSDIPNTFSNHKDFNQLQSQEDYKNENNSIFSLSKLRNNPYFSAGFGLIFIGATLNVFKNSLQKFTQIMHKKVFTTLEVPSKDVSFSWLLQWLIAKGNISNQLGLETSFIKDSSGFSKTYFDFVPAVGRHYCFYKRRLLIVDRERDKSVVDYSCGSPWETLTFTAFSHNQSIFRELLEEAQLMNLQREEGKTIIYNSCGQEWRPFGSPKRVRPYDSVILQEGLSEHIFSDIQEFLSNSKWYFDKGIPYRRGYLLYGPPGCGKSSFVMCIAGRLKYNICVLNVSDPFLTDDRLQYLLATIPPRTLLLLEDIDGAVRKEDVDEDVLSLGSGDPNHDVPSSQSHKKDNPKSYGTRRVSFSGLLNSLDGVIATEERIIFMTTNHADRLPTSLIRPGRVDLKIRIGFASRYQLIQMFLRFFPDEINEANNFSEILKDMQISMAELQGFFMFCKNSSKDALKMAHKWKETDEEARLSFKKE